MYRKPSFTGLGLSFFSFIPKSIKTAVLQSAIYRAFKLCSSYKLFDCELGFLKTFFKNNGFPSHLINFSIRKFLSKQYDRVQMSFDVPKLKKYLTFPYFGEQSVKMKQDITEVLTAFYPYIDFRVVLRNSFTTGSLFKFKDRVPKECSSGVIYKFCCPSCGGSYIGSTNVRLKTRVCQHLGISDRTGRMSLSPPQSSVRDHSLQCDTPFSISDFSILGRAQTAMDLRILESLHIFKERPTLNGKNSAAPLNIVT